MSTTTDLLEQTLAGVAKARADRDAIEGRVKALRAAFEDSIRKDLDALAALKKAADDAEAAARVQALACYELDKTNKAPALGAGIKVSRVYTYDAAKALEWARKSQMCLVPESLDVKAFEKVLKASPASFDFVTSEDVPSATLGSDLSAYLSTIAEVTPADVEEAPF